MKKVLIVGSGASGVHFALSLLQKGYEVCMLDVGNMGAGAANPLDSFNQLKHNLPDPAQYFLGERYQGITYPGLEEKEYYGFPPNKQHIFTHPSTFDLEAHGFEPLVSFAQGGLAGAWTGGVYPLNDAELRDFPFQYRDLEPYYNEVARRIGIVGEKDDLARFYPWHEHLLKPLMLDDHSENLLVDYERHRSHIRHKLQCYMGRSRVATLSQEQNGRQGCSYCGRCLWGCPSESLYTPVVTLKENAQYDNFRYIPHMYVSHFVYDESMQIQSIMAESVLEKKKCEFFADIFVLAAGTLVSSKIFIESIRRRTSKIIKLTGLMDNRQILIPFVNLKMIGKLANLERYQYHQIALGIETEKPEEYIHGQLTTLKSAMAHPIISSLPFDLRTSISLFRNLRCGLGVVNVNMHDRRRENNFVTVRADPRVDHSKLVIHYTPDIDESHRIKRAIKQVKRLLWTLGCVSPPGMIHVRPMGASVHYAGTIPMSMEPLPLTASHYCQSHDFHNLYIVDGTTLPFLPAKNLTFTLMANAARVADQAF